MPYVLSFDHLKATNKKIVGGKNASLGEMIQHLSVQGIKVPGGFATTTKAFREFLAQGNLDYKIDKVMSSVEVQDMKALNKASAQIQRWIIATPLLPKLEKEISLAYAQLADKTVAVRSSATAEDLPTASFAGQQETFLNIRGLQNVLQAVKLVFASLFTSRAIAYRHHKGFSHVKVGLSAGIQAMVRSDRGASGVMFTLDTESGFDQVVLINASYGLGEAVVQGKVSPDEFYVSKVALTLGKQAILSRKLGDKGIKIVYGTKKNVQHSLKSVAVACAQRLKFCLTDREVHLLAQQAQIIEQYYGKPMDIEWAKDGLRDEIYIVQARPETINSQKNRHNSIQHFYLEGKGPLLVSGSSVGQSIGVGKAQIIFNPKNTAALKKGEVLVTDMTDPDWEPLMKNASAIVTNRGGRTCHAAIIARELGIPAIVGCGSATTSIKENEPVTVSCAEGQVGHVYQGSIPYQIKTINIKKLPRPSVKICLILGNPGKAFTYQYLPNDGVGLARLEFIISNTIGIHPNALLNFETLPAPLKKQVSQRIAGYESPVEFYIEKLQEGISTIAAAFYPKLVIFRFSDFKSNEYANLLGGELFEPTEENPMIGFRGASRYINKSFQQCFALECQAFKRVHEDMGLTNAAVMVPFVRTVAELEAAIKLIAQYGLKRGEDGIKIYMMCEVPSNALSADQFLKHVDGFSIGSNDLTQLTLGLDRDSAIVAPLFDERNEAVKLLIEQAIMACNKEKKYIGICGQAPSDHPDLARWLVEKGIDSLSLSPDTIVETWLLLGKTEGQNESS